jgi:hypothetical protein
MDQPPKPLSPSLKPAPSATPAAAATAESEKIQVPVEFTSMNGFVRVQREGDQTTIMLHPTIVQEIGAYHRCRVKVIFRENQGIQVIPILP